MTPRPLKKLIFIILAGAIFVGLVAPSVLLSSATPAPEPDADDFTQHVLPDDRLTVTDARSGIAGAELFQFDENGRLKYSRANWVVPLNDPKWRASTEADHMKPDDPVLGLYLRGQSWGLPWWVMKNHHVANLMLEGQPVLIAFCEDCSSGIARDPVVDGRRLTFHIAGLYNGSILLADYETKTYWTPFTGEALEGALKGKKLKQIPLIQCRWKEWIQLHPKSLVAYGPIQWRLGHGSRKAPGGDRTSFLRLLLKPLDQRLQFNEPVLGVIAADKTRAYPLATLDGEAHPDTENVAVNDMIGKERVVILHQRSSWLTTVFHRRFRDKTLQFVSDKDGRFMDSTYHSHWNYQGQAVDGPVAGQKLSNIDSRVEDWYIWAAYYPTTSIFGGGLGKKD